MFAIRRAILSQSKSFVRFNSSAAWDEAIAAVRQDLKTNIRSRADPLEKNVIRSILTEVKNFEVSHPEQTNDEFHLYDLLNKMIKQRKETAAEYMKEGSPDRFQQVGLNELREVPYLKKYLESLPVASPDQVDAKVEAIAKALKEQDQLTIKTLFSRIPWGTISSEWQASRSSVTESVNRIFAKLSN
ncbi:carbon-nitrogen ligase activity, with glutamine as amido-N-donor protein [[Candida] boidinii]|uniref:Unnamed protein product n=1 Tax=Candida boidinii TaxID=5477 RepID=A0ACB5TGE9_CANBO|nr:carbon-nitrogen ligase activity, with glutamine as amido-N-donor protein [[Candida] boidinii]OWB61895.1 carbon-nitrogen ligase activity, with glutamine as amido-N-donor protein [[Candida] boidinii]OWB72900.1 carbon-nitrogen ligase activity, with glutamine as amido-N-donor protein [[Candida] boidinii]OWB78435.1 carbon-nitrogen ligase activity, with glutamine as amido-N-donor protein [[Candida] boidinii]GME87817.1 unnamed protein product [[Candida] boidinii]